MKFSTTLSIGIDRALHPRRMAGGDLDNFEAGKRAPYDRTLLDLQAALEWAGVEFIPENGGGAGVRLRK
ncbi:MAG: transcriptional regulator [Mesorhizobium sp.]|nr:hypothetical protein [Mesorhizobium sp.]ESZ07892.1 DNA-binding protein [Mesorhizobium sp. L48C026A00]RWN51258.1 MAG: transcriptional regulator [Mesorhizobium sp.]RWN56963.1 MAG: transcriptional regulator [Mesorhizobium sp.]RWN72276.1 MAG: transcriptional regulator [Mesorhizobium sp.]RWN72725.1 MAG: transcriptional regulator [Mesorhizobium sp.]